MGSCMNALLTLADGSEIQLKLYLLIERWMRGDVIITESRVTTDGHTMYCDEPIFFDPPIDDTEVYWHRLLQNVYRLHVDRASAPAVNDFDVRVMERAPTYVWVKSGDSEDGVVNCTLEATKDHALWTFHFKGNLP
jgi:hypothetical protein